jgi:hypothetical protein
MSAPPRFKEYMMHRRYLCGHPDEYIWVERNAAGDLYHYIIKGYQPSPEEPPVSFTMQKCIACATEKPNQAAKETAVKQGKPTRRSGHRDGFMAALERFKYGENLRGDIVPHAKVEGEAHDTRIHEPKGPRSYTRARRIHMDAADLVIHQEGLQERRILEEEAAAKAAQAAQSAQTMDVFAQTNDQNEVSERHSLDSETPQEGIPVDCSFSSGDDPIESTLETD